MDLIDRQKAIDALGERPSVYFGTAYEIAQRNQYDMDKLAIETVPSEQPEPCEYYAICRHGSDEDKLRARLKFCEYCNEDSDGYVKPIEKNGHAFIRFGMNGWEISLRAKGWNGSAKIMYCPVCGRRLGDG